MRNKNQTILLAVLVLGLAACTSIPCAAPLDKATCQVNYYLGVADQVDVGLQTLKASGALVPNVVKYIDVYHNGLPALKDATNEALAAYEAGKSQDYQTALNLLIQFYTNVNAIITAAGGPDQVAAAKAVVK